MISLERRLRHSLAWSLLLLTGVLWLLGSLAAAKMAQEFVASRLIHDAEAILATLEPGPEGLRPGVKHVMPVYQRPFSGHYFLIQTADKVIRSRSLWDWELAIKPVAVGESRISEASGPDGQQLLVWSGGFSKQDRDVTILVAEDLNPVRRWGIWFQWGIAVAGLLGLAILLLVQRQVLRRTFLPLDGVRDEMRALERGEADALSEDVPAEVRILVVEFNRLLENLRQKISRSRNAVGNLAHALKGPLNLLFQDLERAPDSDHLQKHAKSIRDLMERELRRAKLVGNAVPGIQFAPCEELPVLIRVLQQLYADKCPEFEIDCPDDLLLPMDRDDLLEVMGNLLDNGCKWAQEKVRLTLSFDEKLLLVVEDDGPGVSTEVLQRLADRGVRLDETVDGHGLGLSIVKEIADLYGGTLDFDCAGPLGGLRIKMELPLIGDRLEM